MSTIKTRNCVICGSPDICVAGGHVIRKDTYVGSVDTSMDIVIIASRCDKHKDVFRENGYFGEYKKWMGMCDNPFKKDIKKLNFTEITSELLNHINSDESEQFAQRIGISIDDFEDYLSYVKVVEIGDSRGDCNP